MSASDHINTQQFVHQEWFHAGEHPQRDLRQGGERPVHVGTRDAALQRIDPRKWGPAGEFPEIPHARLYRVTLTPGARVHPQIHGDDDEAGSIGFDTGKHYDAVPYTNNYEDVGSVSMVVRNRAIKKVEDLGRHPAWNDPATQEYWRNNH